MSKFVEDYINECLEKGVSKINDICDLATQEIESIDEEIEHIYILKERRDDLVKVLKNFNKNNIYGKKNKEEQEEPELVNINKTPSYNDLLVKICDKFVDDSPLTTSIIISSIGYENKDPTHIYVALKWLLDCGILERDENRSFKKGPAWTTKNDLLNN